MALSLIGGADRRCHVLCTLGQGEDRGGRWTGLAVFVSCCVC